MIFKKVVSANLSQEYCDRMNAAYPQIMGHSNPVTFREYLERLIDRATATPATTDTAEIDNLVKSLENANQQLADQLHEISVLKMQLQNIQNIPTPPADQIIIEFGEVQNYVINEMAALESKRTGKAITPAMVLTHLFKQQIYYGPGDWLPRIYTISELQKIKSRIDMANSLKEVEQLNDPANE
jgi:hypothetical protein